MRQMDNTFSTHKTLTIESDIVVSHTTCIAAALAILKDGFKTGYELGIAERRQAIFFADKRVNPDMYARNKDGETYSGQQSAYVDICIRGLRLLNMNYKEPNGNFSNYEKYNHHVVQGNIHALPPEVDGAISFLDDGRIYEVVLPKNIANQLLFGKKE